MTYNGGYYYLWGSKGTCCGGVNSTYYTVIGRSASITGPFLDQSGVDMLNGGGTTILTGASPKVAAGGADEFDDGTTQRLAYHFYDANNNGQETLDIRTITYSNGWPVLSAPLGWTFCANENATCSFSGTNVVLYGANDAFYYKTATSSIACTNAAFGGDPIYGTVKSCYRSIQPPNNDWTQCASENGTCSFSGIRTVAYGANNAFYYKATSSIACNNATFGDPIYGTAKFCYYK